MSGLSLRDPEFDFLLLRFLLILHFHHENKESIVENDYLRSTQRPFRVFKWYLNIRSTSIRATNSFLKGWKSV